MPKEAKQFLVGVYTDEDQIIAVTKAATDAGLPVYDTFTPYAVHGLDAAQKLPRSKLTFVCGAGGTLGFLTSFFLQTYTQGIETPFLSGWPIDVGGKPVLPFPIVEGHPASSLLPAFVPVLFELTVLFAGLISAAGLLVFCGLFPGKKPRLHIEGVTDDRFAIAIDPTGKGYDEAEARALLNAHGAVDVSFLGENA